MDGVFVSILNSKLRYFGRFFKCVSSSDRYSVSQISVERTARVSQNSFFFVPDSDWFFSVGIGLCESAFGLRTTGWSSYGKSSMSCEYEYLHGGF